MKYCATTDDNAKGLSSRVHTGVIANCAEIVASCYFSLPFNSAHYIMLYPQNGDRILTIDSVTTLHPVYSPRFGIAYQFRPTTHARQYAGQTVV